MKKLLLLLLMTTTISANTELLDPNIPKAEQYQRVINALDYIRNENKEIGDRVSSLMEETELAAGEANLTKMMDIIIRVLLFTTRRFKYYEENFQNYVLGIDIQALEASLQAVSAIESLNQG